MPTVTRSALVAISRVASSFSRYVFFRDQLRVGRPETTAWGRSNF